MNGGGGFFWNIDVGGFLFLCLEGVNIFLDKTKGLSCWERKGCRSGWRERRSGDKLCLCKNR